MRTTAKVDRDWTKGSIFGNLWFLSWPLMVSNALNVAGPTVDMIWVGRLGAASIAGVGVAGMVVMVVDSLKQGLLTGLRAMVARFVGAGDSAGANHIAQQGFVVSAIFGLIIAAVGLFLAEPIMLLLGVESDVVEQGAAYMQIQLIGSVFMGLRMLTEGIMQASGDTVTPMRITIFFRFLHVVLDPFLIFGWWFFPRWGVAGAAAANLIAQSLGMSLGLWVLLTGRSRLRLTFKDFHPDASIIWRLLRIGLPASFMGMERSFAQVVLVKFVSPFGTAAVAAHSIIDRVDNFLRNPGAGLGMGAGILAGQNLGARQPERAVRSGWLAVGLYTGIMLICSVVIWFWAEAIVGIFSHEPGVVKTGSTFLRIEIISYLVFGLAMVLMQCLNGVGDTVPTMLVTLITIWGVQVPLAYFLPQATTLGVYGVRWAMVAGILIRAVVYSVYFRTGRWKYKKV